MTRKRFVKLLMADGCSRNEANDWARDVAEGYSYVELYRLYRAIPCINDAIGSLSHSIERMVQCICDCVPILVQAITEVMPTVISLVEKAKALEEENGGTL